MAPLNAQGKKILEKIFERFSETRAACERLAEEAKKEAERGKAVRKAKLTEKLTRHFLKQIDSVVVPKGISFSELDRFRSDLERAVSSIARERSIWFPRISPLFIIARRRIDLELTRLAGSITELRNYLSGSYSKAKSIEALSARTEGIMRSLNDAGLIQRQRTDVEEKARHLQEQIGAGTAELESTKKGAELVDLAEMTQRIQQLREQVDYELRHLQKPFLKFTNLTQETGAALPSEELQKLHQYLVDPLAALATEEPGYPRLKSILNRVGRLMSEGRLKLKGTRVRRGLQEIEEITRKDRLDKLQKECSDAFHSYQLSRSSKETEAAKSKYEQLQRGLEELVRQKEAAEARLGTLEDGEKQLLEKVEGQRKELEKLTLEDFGKKIVLKL